VDTELRFDGALRGGKALGDDSPAVDPARARWMPERPSVGKDVLACQLDVLWNGDCRRTGSISVSWVSSRVFSMEEIAGSLGGGRIRVDMAQKCST